MSIPVTLFKPSVTSLSVYKTPAKLSYASISNSQEDQYAAKTPGLQYFQNLKAPATKVLRLMNLDATQYTHLCAHVDQILQAVAKKDYATARKLVEDTETAKKCGLKLLVFRDTFHTVPSLESQLWLLTHRASAVSKCLVSPSYRMGIYSPCLESTKVSKADDEQFKTFSDQLVSYIGMEEWFHTLQFASPGSLSSEKGFSKSIQSKLLIPKALSRLLKCLPSENLASQILQLLVQKSFKQRTVEYDYPLFLMEKGIPFPVDLMIPYNRAKHINPPPLAKFLDVPLIATEAQDLVKNSFEGITASPQLHINKALQNLKIGETEKFSKYSTSVLLHTPPANFLQLQNSYSGENDDDLYQTLCRNQEGQYALLDRTTISIKRTAEKDYEVTFSAQKPLPGENFGPLNYAVINKEDSKGKNPVLEDVMFPWITIKPIQIQSGQRLLLQDIASIEFP